LNRSKQHVIDLDALVAVGDTPKKHKMEAKENLITTQLRTHNDLDGRPVCEPSVNIYQTIHEQKTIIERYWKPLSAFIPDLTTLEETAKKVFKAFKDEI
jgi:hypothetical protein